MSPDASDYAARNGMEDAVSTELTSGGTPYQAQRYMVLREQGWNMERVAVVRLHDAARVRVDDEARAAFEFALLYNLHGMRENIARRFAQETAPSAVVSLVLP